MDLSVLALSVVKQGDKDIPGVTDTVNPKRLGPKRATKLRRFFSLSKEDDVSSILHRLRRLFNSILKPSLISYLVLGPQVRYPS